MAADGGLCDATVRLCRVQVYLVAFLLVAAQHQLCFCVNAVPFRSNMQALYVKQQCDPDHSSFFFFFHPRSF